MLKTTTVKIFVCFWKKSNSFVIMIFSPHSLKFKSLVLNPGCTLESLEDLRFCCCCCWKENHCTGERPYIASWQCVLAFDTAKWCYHPQTLLLRTTPSSCHPHKNVNHHGCQHLVPRKWLRDNALAAQERKSGFGSPEPPATPGRHDDRLQSRRLGSPDRGSRGASWLVSLAIIGESWVQGETASVNKVESNGGHAALTSGLCIDVHTSPHAHYTHIKKVP